MGTKCNIDINIYFCESVEIELAKYIQILKDAKLS